MPLLRGGVLSRGGRDSRVGKQWSISCHSPNRSNPNMPHQILRKSAFVCPIICKLEATVQNIFIRTVNSQCLLSASYKGQIELKADWRAINSPKKQTKFFFFSFFGRIYGTPICRPFYLTFYLFKLGCGPVGQKHMHSTLNFCPARKKSNIQKLKCIYVAKSILS